jgi:hypothetical protein
MVPLSDILIPQVVGETDLFFMIFSVAGLP